MQSSTLFWPIVGCLLACAVLALAVDAPRRQPFIIGPMHIARPHIDTTDVAPTDAVHDTLPQTEIGNIIAEVTHPRRRPHAARRDELEE